MLSSELLHLFASHGAGSTTLQENVESRVARYLNICKKGERIASLVLTALVERPVAIPKQINDKFDFKDADGITRIWPLSVDEACPALYNHIFFPEPEDNIVTQFDSIVQGEKEKRDAAINKAKSELPKDIWYLDADEERLVLVYFNDSEKENIEFSFPDMDIDDVKRGKAQPTIDAIRNLMLILEVIGEELFSLISITSTHIIEEVSKELDDQYPVIDVDNLEEDIGRLPLSGDFFLLD